MGTRGPKPGTHHAGTFKPGNKLACRKKVPEDVKIAREESYASLLRAIAAVEALTDSDISKVDKSKLTMRELLILEAYENKDYKAILAFQDRLYGKPTESSKIDLDVKGERGVYILSVPEFDSIKTTSDKE